MLLSRARVLVFRYVAMTAAALLVVLVYRRILHVNQTTVALTFLVMVQVAAFRWGLVYSVCLSVGCTLLYNYFFLPPIGSFTIADPQNWIALLSFLASAIFISKISENERRQTALSEGRRSELERLYEFSNQLLMEENLHDVARPRAACGGLHLRFRRGHPLSHRERHRLFFRSAPVFCFAARNCVLPRGCPMVRGPESTECASFPWCWACGRVDRLP